MSDDTYQGWSNRETWALNLWLTNDQGLYELTRERVTERLEEIRRYDPPQWVGTAAEHRRHLEINAGETVKEFWEELTDPSEGLMSIENILTMVRDIGSEYRVNWDEIGAYWLSDLDES